MNPRYTYPPQVMIDILRDMLLQHRRSFRDDARAIIARLEPPLHIQGEQFVPSREPCVLTMNHYARTGFHIWWAALAISAVLPSPVHWIITSEWTAPGKWYEPLISAISRFTADRIVHIFDFTSMPPMPPRAWDVAARAASIRAVLTYAKQNARAAMIGLAPEGGDQPHGGLTRPAPGVGRFCLLLAAQDLKFIPMGVYESEGEFYQNFGKAYELNVCHDLSTKDKDRLSADIIMSHIATLLPFEFRGEFN